MTQKVVLIGAGSANFGLGTMGELFKSDVFKGSVVCLLDINPSALQRVETMARKFVQENHLPYKIEATTNRVQALQGATFCIISIEVGNRFELWNQDWQIPLQYGIRQVYGENGGPGGLFHSLRIIPPILDICEDIQRICPQAWIFNFSNPMSRICTTVKLKYPGLTLVGLCHEAGSLPEHLPAILNTPLANLEFQAGGLNHFSVLVNIKYKDSGKDAYPDVRIKAPPYFENIVLNLDWALQEMSPFLRNSFGKKNWSERGVFKIILEKFGYLPITTDSHFGEYIQWAYDVADHQAILDFYRAYQFWVSQRISEERLLEGSGEGWSLRSLMEGILTDSQHFDIAVNVPNAGLIPGLPDWLVVEVPGFVDKNGIHGVSLPDYPKSIAGLLQNQVAVHSLTAEAVISRSRDAALQALLVDPVVDGVKKAEELLETMIKVQNRYLSYLS
jgi:alpha-galactosidase